MAAANEKMISASENTDNGKGEDVTGKEYREDIFLFEKSGEKTLKTRRMFIRLTLLEWTALIFSFLIRGDKGRNMYISIPLALVVFPLLYQSLTVPLLMKRGGEYRREEMVRVTRRLPYALISSFFLSLLSAVSHAAAWMTALESSEDAVFLSLTLALVFISSSLFLKRKDLSMKRADSTVLQKTECKE